jgi:glycosyltransferase involved in cell wall biosynthesis
MRRGQNAVESTSARPTYVFVLPWDLHHLGGVNQVVLNLYDQVLSAGEMQPLIMVNQWSALRPNETVIDGRPTVYLRLSSPWTDRRPILGLVKWVIASPVWIFDMLRFVRHHRVSTFNFHFPGLGVFPIALLRFLRLYRGALILSFHGSDLRNAVGKSRVENALWRFVLRSATAIVTPSQALAEAVRKFAGEAGLRLHVIPNGLDVTSFLSNVDRESGLPATLQNREFILSVATWEAQKGLDILVRAFADLRRTNADIALVFVGRAGDAESQLRSLAEELGVANDVFFVEGVPHARIGLYLERAKAFCLPSRAESFGIVILEAGAYRLPVVASLVGGIPEIIVHEDTGLLTPPEDVAALAAALGRVLNDAELAGRLGGRLYHRVLGEFSWTRSYQEYRKLVPRS